MSRKCKTPAKLVAAIDNHRRHIMNLTECIRVKTTVPVENQANHIQEGTIAGWIGRAQGINAMLETILFEFNCYAGFGYVGATPKNGEEGAQYLEHVGPQHPEYADWRVNYYAR